MSVNLKQRELSLELFTKLKREFPEVRFAGIEENANDADSIWVNIVTPQKDDRYIAFVKLSSALSSDILDDYGYHIMSVSSKPKEAKKLNRRSSASQKRATAYSRQERLQSLNKKKRLVIA